MAKFNKNVHLHEYEFFDFETKEDTNYYLIINSKHRGFNRQKNVRKIKIWNCLKIICYNYSSFYKVLIKIIYFEIHLYIQKRQALLYFKFFRLKINFI